MDIQRAMQVQEQYDSLPTEAGSIRLFLEGSEDGLQRLADLHQSGELQGLLNELKPDDMPEIVVTKAEFTTDARVIEIGFRL